MKFTESVDIIVLVLVVGVGAWVWTAGLGTNVEAAEKAVARADDAITRLESALETDSYASTDGAAVLDYLETLPDELSRQWAPKPIERDSSTGVFYDADSLADLRDGRDLELRFLEPLNVVATTELGSITVSFQENERSTVYITGYRVYRTGGDGQESVVAELERTKTSWVDRDVKAGHLYSYRVTAVTDEEILVNRGRSESPRSAAITVRGKRDYEIVPKGWNAEAGIMRVLVRKHHHGSWYEKEFDAVAGQGIGEVDPGSTIDYGTACVVEKFETREETVEETRDEVTFDLEGRVVVAEDGNPIRTRRTYNRPRSIVVLVIKNELGQREKIEYRP